MATNRIKIIAVHPADLKRSIAAGVKITGNGISIETEIPREGRQFELEIEKTYHILANSREDNFGLGERNPTIKPTDRTLKVPLVPMGEECRIWLENIKRMIERGESQKAKRNIRTAKKVYKLMKEVPKEIIQILDLEKDIPGHTA